MLGADQESYDGWELDANGLWHAIGTARLDASGVGTFSVADEPGDRTVPRGSAFWLVRKAPSATSFFLYGQFDDAAITNAIAGGTTQVPAYTMLAPPGLSAVAINDIDWQGKPLANDTIAIPREGLAPLTLTWRRRAWGYAHSAYDPDKGKIVTTRVTDIVVPAGTGFWYTRRGEGFTITWPLVWPEAAE